MWSFVLVGPSTETTTWNSFNWNAANWSGSEVSEVIGEVQNAYDRTLHLPLNDLPTASFRVRMDNPLAKHMTDVEGDILLKVYQGSTLRFIGDLTSIEESGGEQPSLACNFAGPLWRLRKRLSGKDASGRTFTTEARGQIMSDLLDEANTDDDTKIEVGSIGSLSASSIGTYYFKPVAEVMTELAAAATSAGEARGFDFEFAPLDFGVGGETNIAQLNVAGTIGTDQPHAVFEYGTGNRTVKSFKRVIDREGLLNQAFSLPDSFPAETLEVKSATDLGSIGIRGLFEEVVPTSDVTDPELRQLLMEVNVSVRSIARQVVTFEPSTDAPQFGTDYSVGDTVRARAIIGGVTRFDSTMRVYGVDISITDEGKEEIVPILVPE